MIDGDFTQDFEDWWEAGYGMMGDSWSSMESWQRHRIKLIAYRAFKRGKKMAKKVKK